MFFASHCRQQRCFTNSIPLLAADLFDVQGTLFGSPRQHHCDGPTIAELLEKQWIQFRGGERMKIAVRPQKIFEGTARGFAKGFMSLTRSHFGKRNYGQHGKVVDESDT